VIQVGGTIGDAEQATLNFGGADQQQVVSAPVASLNVSGNQLAAQESTSSGASTTSNNAAAQGNSELSGTSAILSPPTGRRART